MGEIDFEPVGLLVDRLDNYAAASVLPLPDKMRLDLLTNLIRESRDELKAWLAAQGFNPWGDQ